MEDRKKQDELKTRKEILKKQIGDVNPDEGFSIDEIKHVSYLEKKFEFLKN